MQYKKIDCPYLESNCPGDKELSSNLDCECVKFKAYVDSKKPEIIKKILDDMKITATSKMDIMLSMQKIFAGKFHKIDNLTKSEMDHWTNEYLVCIEDEIVEAEEFLDIYPIKIKDFNLKEFRKELIDILHFLMDGMLVVGMTYEDIEGKYLNGRKINVDLLDHMIIKEKIHVDQIIDDKQYLYLLNYLLRDIRLVRQCISWKHWKKPSESIDKDAIFAAYIDMFRHLMQLFIAAEMDSDIIYETYVQKNIENILRNSYGY